MAKKKSSPKTEETPQVETTTSENKHQIASLAKYRLAIILGSFFGLLFLMIVGSFIAFQNRILPFISVAGIDLTLINKEGSTHFLQNQLASRFQPITFEHEGQLYTINLTPEIVDWEKAATEAFIPGHSSFYLPPKNITLAFKEDPSLKAQFDTIASVVDMEPISSQLKVADNQVTVSPSQDGLVLDRDLLKSAITDYLNTGILTQKQIALKTQTPTLSYQTALEIKRRLDEINKNPIILKYEDLEFKINLETALSLIDLNNTQSTLIQFNTPDLQAEIKSAQVGNEQISDQRLVLDKQKTEEYLKTIAKRIDQPVVEPLFSFDAAATGGSKVKEFKPPQQGRALSIEKNSQLLSNAFLNSNQTEVQLVVETVEPKNQLTNDLGVVELIGEGSSRFSGSIPNRIYNVGHGAAKINGVLIPPGGVFSFNQTVGDITAATGFKQAYVIKSGRTVLDDGGGICQVSTTLFRAVLNAGLPIVTRTAHAYRVGYYEQDSPPGLDATIFYPTVDFQFKNDTNHHILIQTEVVGTSMAVNLYGTKDGRQVSVTKPVIHSQTPPLPELRQDDPTLPKGEIKQVDWAAWGANVSFKRTVVKNGQPVIDDTFRSNYRSWQAVYLVGTKEG